MSIHRELELEVALAQEAYRLSQTDELTGLLNRRGFLDLVARHFTELKPASGAIAFVDINGLKQVNDLDGHLAGDELINTIAQTIRTVLRPYDVVGRLGGDEFAVFAADLDPAALQDRLATVLSVRASVGTAEVLSADGLHDALLRADAEMYTAKRSALLA